MTRTVWGFILAGLALSVLLAAFVSPFVSQAPDGLEKFADDHGIAEKSGAGPAWRHAPMPDYKVAGVRSESVSTALAGIAGTLLVFGVALGAARLISRKRSAETKKTNLTG